MRETVGEEYSSGAACAAYCGLLAADYVLPRLEVWNPLSRTLLIRRPALFKDGAVVRRRRSGRPRSSLGALVELGLPGALGVGDCSCRRRPSSAPSSCGARPLPFPPCVVAARCRQGVGGLLLGFSSRGRGAATLLQLRISSFRTPSAALRSLSRLRASSNQPVVFFSPDRLRSTAPRARRVLERHVSGLGELGRPVLSLDRVSARSPPGSAALSPARNSRPGRSPAVAAMSARNGRRFKSSPSKWVSL